MSPAGPAAGDPVLLAIETSCDETAVAVMRGRGKLLASLVSSQIAIHRAYGGVVPEVASRNHLGRLRPLLEEAVARAGVEFRGVDAFAATAGPGLASSLLVGVSAAKGLAAALGRPFLAVNHLEGHLLSPFFLRPEGVVPCISLVVSGGHTLLVELRGVGDYRLLGRTRDDAAGEAFDKVAKLLGLPYPGGPEIDRLARGGDPRRFAFPRGMLGGAGCEFSFSGLKTAVRYILPKLGGGDVADVCASFQEAVVDVLVTKTIRAAEESGHDIVAMSGGVSCNSRLRDRMQGAAAAAGMGLLVAEPALCTDNAAMIANVGMEKFLRGECASLEVDIDPNLPLVVGA